MSGMLDVTVTAMPASPLSLFHQSSAFFFRPPREVCIGHSQDNWKILNRPIILIFKTILLLQIAC